MSWRLIEVPENKDVQLLTDDEVICLYILLTYSSSNNHRTIADKLRPMVELAKHNRHIHHSWENEGGTVINGSDNGTHSSSSSGNT